MTGMVNVSARSFVIIRGRMKFTADIREAFLVGLASARANVVPMVVLWMMAVALVVGYYFVPSVAVSLEPLKRWQIESGCLAAFLNRFFFCGVVPGVFLLSVRSISPLMPVTTAFAQGVWGGVSGVVYDFFYRWQCVWFGDGVDVATLLKKLLVDQFVITVFVIAPLNVLVFFWISRGFSFARFRFEFPRPFFSRALLPNLVTNWCVWIPVALMIYAFPLALQVQVSGFACAFWALTCLQIGRRSSSVRSASQTGS